MGVTLRVSRRSSRMCCSEPWHIDEHDPPEQRAGHEFFLLVRRYTVMGYYTSRVGLEELDFPGFKLYTESPACPHIGRSGTPAFTAREVLKCLNKFTTLS